MERKVKIYKPIKEWKLGDIESRDPSDIILSTLILGEYQQKGKTLSYITTEIYKQILEAVVANPEQYKITINLGMLPILTISCGGQLVIYNHHVKEQFHQLKNILSTISKVEIFDSFKEMRFNMDGKGKLGTATQFLMAKINKEASRNFDAPFSPIFVREAISSVLEEEFIPATDECAEYLRSLSYKELLAHTFEVVSYQWKKTVTEEYLLEIIEQAEDKEKAMYDFYQKINDELLLRFLKGTMKGR